MQKQIIDVKNFGNAVCYGCYGEKMLETIRNQMQRFRDHNMEPLFVLMNSDQYRKLVAYAESIASARHNTDENSVNGLPIVICERISEPTVTTSPGELDKHGLL